MRNKRLVFRNNKGVAMVTVMIAIAFISILGTAMLYSSAKNYAMKSSNLRSKENYYETEGELVKVTSAIRNSSMSDSDPVTYIENNLKNSTDGNKYSCKGIAELVYPSGTTISGGDTSCNISTSNGDTIYFKYASTGSDDGMITKKTKTDDASIPDNVTRYTLKNFVVSQTSAQGFENSVKTDIVFDVFVSESGGGSSGGVGNMSILLDSYIETTSSQLPSLTMTGNTFLTSYETNTTSWESGTYTAPGKHSSGHDAVKITTESKINFAGEHNVVYGDIYLSGKGSLYVNGDLTVFGDIFIDGNATLIVAGNGKIYMMNKPGEYLPGRDHVSKITFSGGASASHNLYPSTLQNNIVSIDKAKYIEFSNYLNLSNNTRDDDGLLKKILKKNSFNGSDKYITEFNKNINGLSVKTGFTMTADNNDFRSLYSGYMGRNIGFGMIPVSYNANLNGNHTNLLIISASPNKNPFTQNAEYSTYIGAKPIAFNIQHGIILTKLGTSEFNYITAAKGDAESARYNDDAKNPFNNIIINFDGVGDYNCKIGQFFQKECNTYVDEMYAMGTNGGSTGVKKYASTIYFKNFARDID